MLDFFRNAKYNSFSGFGNFKNMDRGKGKKNKAVSTQKERCGMNTEPRHDDGIHEVYEEEFVDYNEVLKAKKLTFQDIRDHMSGPVFSIMAHMVIIALLSAWIVTPKPKKEIFIETRVMPIPKTKLPDIKPPPEDTTEDVPTDVPVDRTIEKPQDVEVEPVEKIETPTPNQDVVLDMKLTNSALILPVPVGRIGRDPGTKKRKVKIYDSEGGSQKPLIKGLRWLKDHQNPDGSWGDSKKENIPAYTGLALLAFLGYGATPSSQEFGPTVIKAIKKLTEFVGQDANGVRGGYRHGIVMYALNEAYIMTQIPMLENLVKKGSLRIVRGMNAKGSFNYGYNNSKMRSDLSVAGWNYQALKAAFVSGCEIDGLVPAIDKLIDKGLKETHYVKAGGFSYADSGGPKGTMTSVGTLCLQLYGESKSKQVKTGLRYLEQPNQAWFNWKGHNKKVPQWALYQWYYQGQVFFTAYEGKGSKWRKWNKMMVRELKKRQKSDGRWESPQFTFGTKEKKGGHGEGSLKGLDQPVYSTSLCCLMLEVYYRTLSTSAKNNLKVPSFNAAEDEDNDLKMTDVKIL